MKKCSECGGKMKEEKAMTLEGIEYSYYKCAECGEEILNMQQLHQVADQYRTLRRYQVKLSKWGLSLGIRIPKEVVEKYKLREEDKVTVIPEKKGIKIIPS